MNEETGRTETIYFCRKAACCKGNQTEILQVLPGNPLERAESPAEHGGAFLHFYEDVQQKH